MLTKVLVLTLLIITVAILGASAPIVTDNAPLREEQIVARAMTLTLTPTADAYVNSESPSTSKGSSTQLRIDGSPIVNSYLRFTVSGFAGVVTQATLRIYANSNLSAGYVVHAVDDNTWRESTLTFSNAPTMGASLGRSAPITAGTWTSVDVTAYVTGNGTFSFGLTDPSSTAVSLASRESENPPQLVVASASRPSFAPTATAGVPSPTPTERASSPTPTKGSSATPAPTKTFTPTANPRASKMPSFSRIYTIVMENEEYGDIVGHPSAPYINGLIAQYGLATNYDAIAHPSEPNYIALFSGSTQGVTTNDTYNLGAKNVADQIEATGRSWKVFAQNVPLNCFKGTSSSGGEDGSGTYVRKHEPAISFTDISGSVSRCANITDFSHFSPAAADYEFIVPNTCNSMHDCSISTGDNWLKGFVPKILGSAAWQNGGVLFITWDEGTSDIGGGGHVATRVIAKGVSKSATAHNHYSLLRTIQDAWGLGCLASTCSANNLAEFFP